MNERLEVELTPTALVVEDEPDVRELISIVLTDVGFVVRTAADGAEALVDLEDEAKAADLVVLDLRMPGVNGWDVLQAIRANEVLRDLPVVLCTVDAQATDLERAWTLGCDGYVQKPFTVQELAQEALAAITRTPAARDALRRQKLGDPDR